MIRAPKICGGSHIRAGLSGYAAEITAGLVCAELGLPNELHDSHASYVGHWLGILKADKTAIIHAASKAEQAFAYLTAFGEAGQAGSAPPPALAAAA
ncbi:zincin-like metallopeptidase domain-containing protein [Sphingobium amiense]|uniref:zincin-like metallopeptidase domain-containing protein n=2 Tax=Sphingobium amiense TaxID=135719 RepID=UPI000F817978